MDSPTNEGSSVYPNYTYYPPKVSIFPAPLIKMYRWENVENKNWITESHNINPWIYYTWHGSMASDFLKYFSTLETAHAWQDFCFISGNVTKLISSQCSQQYSFFGNLCDYINCSIMSPNKMWSFWTHFTKHRPILIIFLSSQQVHSRYVDNIYKYLHK